MPEYLAPGVYVEEVDTGPKPIEGVSTSTTGVVGVTERGPIDVPILVTSNGEFHRWFGGELPADGFPKYRFLPHAVEGFFTNGGKRLFVVRVTDDAAATASATLFHHKGTPAESRLLGPAPAGAGDVFVLGSALAAGTNATWVRVGGGSTAEYRQLTGPSAATKFVAVWPPLDFAHAAGSTAEQLVAAASPAAAALSAAASQGATAITTPTAFTPVANKVIQIGGAATEEFAVVKSSAVAGTTNVITLTRALRQAHAAGDTVSVLEPPATAVTSTLSAAAGGQAGVAFLASGADASFTQPDKFVQFGAGDSVEVRRTVALVSVTVADGPAADYPGGSSAEVVTPADGIETALTTAANIGDKELSLASRVGIEAGTEIEFDPPSGSTYELVVVKEVLAPEDTGPGKVSLTAPLAKAHTTTAKVRPKTIATTTTAAVTPGVTVIEVAARVGVAAGDVIRIGGAADPGREYAVVKAVPTKDPNPKNPDPGRLVLADGLRRSHPAGAAVRFQTMTPSVRAALLLPASQADEVLVLARVGPTAVSAGNLLRVGAPGQPARFHLVTASAALTPHRATLAAPVLENAHAAGDDLVVRQPLLTARALDQGGWGNRLRLSVEDQDPPLVDTCVRKTNGVVDSSHVRLASMIGVEVGTVLQRFDKSDTPLGDPVKVTNIDHSANFLLTVNPAFSPAPLANETIRSVEFRLTVRLLKREDPAAPGREAVEAVEAFPALSLDHRHSRYVHKVIGTTWDPLDPNHEDDDYNPNPLRLVDHRSRGESQFIRIRDTAANEVATEAIRDRPEFLTDLTAVGQIVPARMALDGGDDPEPLPARFIGADDPEPARRTGIYSLQNEDDISIVACPGVTDQAVQQALIDHCEFMRYRFAVLDGPPPPGDSLTDVKSLRQQFDTKYAALYHPWLLIPPPFPANPSAPVDYPIPPSGHMAGIYANTDVTRGVHKAPANEVLRGIVGLRRSLKKGEQDLLNPFPVNINVIRDFRPDSRGLRVWGARVITSDPDWKYVNVRRLFIFVEKSVERGLQWVVFEPNAEPLWARVRRSVSAFLNRVWRDGALEGTTAEQAYFVKVDRTTMTQADIDNGRLIIQVGIAPVKPAEFVIIRIGLFTANAQD